MKGLAGISAPVGRTKRVLWIAGGWLLAGCDAASEPPQNGGDSATLSSAYVSEAGVPTVRITDTASHCSRCEFTASRIGELRNIPSELAWPDIPIVRRSSKGQFIAMVPDHAFNGIYVFDSLGMFERTVGRSGPGPGEARSPISFVLDAGDTVHILDNGRRLSVLTLAGKGIRDVRTAVTINSEIGVSHPYIPQTGGSLIASGSSATPSLAGIPLYIFNVHGEVVKAFGTSNLASIGARTARVLSAGTDAEHVWVAEPTNYRLEEVGIKDGSVSRIIAVVSPWLENQPIMNKEESEQRFAKARVQVVKLDLNARPARVSVPPRTSLRGMQYADGKMWLLWQLPAPKWDTVSTKYPFPEEMRLSNELNDKMWMTAVDVVDIDRGKLLARRYFPFHGHLIAAGFMGHSHYSESGEPVVDVWRMSIVTNGVSKPPTK